MFRFLPFILFTALGLALVGWGHRNLGELAYHRQQDSLKQISGAQTTAIYARLSSGEEALEALPFLFTDSVGTSGGDFQRVARVFLAKHPEFRAVYWAPRVPPGGEAAFVARVRAAGRSGFTIHGGAGRPLSALPGADRYPVLLREFEGTALLPEGADVARLALHAPYVVEARIRGSVTFSAVRVPVPGEDRMSLFAYLPMSFRRSGSGQIAGVLLVEYDIDRLVEGALAEIPLSENIGLVLLDRYAEPGHKLLYANPPPEPGLEQRLISRGASPPEGGAQFTMSVGGRQWELCYFPLSGPPSVWLLGPPWWATAGVALLVLAFAAAVQWFIEGARAMRTLAGRRAGELARSEVLMRGILQSAADAVITIDSEGTVQAFNEAAERMFGYEAGEVIGRNVSMLMPGPYREEHDGYLQEYLVTGVARVIGVGREVPALRKDGTEFPCFLNVSKIRHGDQVLFTSIMRDITVEKQATLSLAQSEQRFREFAEIASDWFWEMDADLRLTWMSERVTEVTGVPVDFHIGKTREELAGEDATTEKWKKHLEDLKARRPFRNFGFWREGHDGRRQYLITSGNPIFGEKGEFLGYRGIGADHTGLRIAEEKLQLSEQKFRDFAEVASDWFWELDADLRFTWFSDKWEEVSGAPVGQLIGEKVSNLPTSEDDKEKWEDLFKTIEARRPFKEFAYWRKQPNGQWKYLSASGIPVYDDDGNFTGYRGVGRDLTQEELAEGKLRANEARFRGLIEGSVQGIAVHRGGAYLFANQAYAGIYGYESPEAILALPSIEAVNVPEDREMLRERGAARLRGEEPQPYYEMRGLRKDGSIIHLSSLNTVIEWDGGEAILTTLTDITERKRAEEALRATAHSLATAQRIAHLGSWEWDIPSGDLQWSDEVYRIFGLEPREIGASFEAFLQAIHPDDRERVEAAIRRALDQDEPYRVEHRVLRPDGTERFVEEQGELRRDEAGQPTRMLGTVHDITERKQIDIMKNEFISIVSHELRTPLTSILGSLGLIRGGVAGEVGGPMQQMVDIAQNNAERLVRLIDDILDIEKIESGAMALQRVPVVLDEVLASALEANRGYAERFHVRLSLRREAREVVVDGDVDKLTQVLTNLISNAVKFSPQGGEVALVLCANDGRARVEVRDQGPGIPQEFQDQIFVKFAQADSTDRRQKGGTGLGLSISKAIVELHGGTIGFDTEQGKGTAFFFTLPLHG